MNVIKKIVRIWRWVYVHLFMWIFYDEKYLKGKDFQNGIDSEGWKWAYRDIKYRMHALNHLEIKWPISPDIEIGGDIVFDPDDVSIMNSIGSYFQALNGKITIGKGTIISNNVGIITTNHDLNDLDNHVDAKDVTIGMNCWIGMNALILPGVVLGDHTIVGGGSVVTKSFKEGNCIIAGNPAKKIKDL